MELTRTAWGSLYHHRWTWNASHRSVHTGNLGTGSLSGRFDVRRGKEYVHEDQIVESPLPGRHTQPNLVENGSVILDQFLIKILRIKIFVKCGINLIEWVSKCPCETTLRIISMVELSLSPYTPPRRNRSVLNKQRTMHVAQRTRNSRVGKWGVWTEP